MNKEALGNDGLRMLFELHHRQLNETQLQIQSITEKSIGLLLAFAGLTALAPGFITPETGYAFLACIVWGTIVAVGLLFSHARGRKNVMIVIGKLNQHFELTTGDSPLYPSSWSSFSDRTIGQIVGAHIFAVVTVSILVCAAIVLKLQGIATYV